MIREPSPHLPRPLARAVSRAAPVLAFVALSAACGPAQAPAATPTVVEPPRRSVDAADAARSAPPPAPPLTIEAARARSTALAARWKTSVRTYEEGSAAAFFRDEALDEATIRALLEATLRACLAERDASAEACKALGPTAVGDPVVNELLEMAGEIADTAPGANDTLRLLARIDARGAWRAGMAIDRVLERRMVAHLGPCEPPTASEVEAARAALADVLVRPAKGPPRPPTEAERADLAYLEAALRDAGPEIGGAVEDDAAPPLPAGGPERARRAVLEKALEDALLDGDVERHAEAAAAFLGAMGYPGPIRVQEDLRPRWGGRGFSYALRDWARSEEILGEHATARRLHPRAAPGGGMCGTSTPSVLADQIQGTIRAGEQSGGCRTIVAERLYATGRDDDAFGPARLSRAGFDVARLYRAALVDTGSLRWADRVRAIPGHAAASGRDAIPRLVELAERGPTAQRALAIETLGQLLESFGLDPCKPSNVGFGRGSSRGERDVRSIMTDCHTKLDDAALGALVDRIGKLAGDADPLVRETVARTLGRTASPRARASLVRLTRDRQPADGTICTSVGDGPQTCEPNRPVRRAAQEGLVELAKAEKVRREQLAAARTKR